MESEGHKIIFEVHGESGYILIRRSGWIGFEYKCYINDNYIVETTETIANNQEPLFKVDIIEYMTTPGKIPST